VKKEFRLLLLAILVAIVGAYILFGCATQPPRLTDDDFKTKGYFNE
jgi:hypothetical protein